MYQDSSGVDSVLKVDRKRVACAGRACISTYVSVKDSLGLLRASPGSVAGSDHTSESDCPFAW